MDRGLKARMKREVERDKNKGEHARGLHERNERHHYSK